MVVVYDIGFTWNYFRFTQHFFPLQHHPLVTGSQPPSHHRAPAWSPWCAWGGIHTSADRWLGTKPVAKNREKGNFTSYNWDIMACNGIYEHKWIIYIYIYIIANNNMSFGLSWFVQKWWIYAILSQFEVVQTMMTRLELELRYFQTNPFLAFKPSTSSASRSFYPAPIRI